MVLGELIIEDRGKITGQRVLDVEGPKGGKLSFLNNLVGVFEYEVDEMGNCSSKVWEWK
jgi:hypothetical protein